MVASILRTIFCRLKDNFCFVNMLNKLNFFIIYPHSATILKDIEIHILSAFQKIFGIKSIHNLFTKINLFTIYQHVKNRYNLSSTRCRKKIVKNYRFVSLLTIGYFAYSLVRIVFVKASLTDCAGVYESGPWYRIRSLWQKLFPQWIHDR